jgi:hypothetical protein
MKATGTGESFGSASRGQAFFHPNGFDDQATCWSPVNVAEAHICSMQRFAILHAAIVGPIAGGEYQQKRYGMLTLVNQGRPARTETQEISTTAPCRAHDLNRLSFSCLISMTTLEMKTQLSR